MAFYPMASVVMGWRGLALDGMGYYWMVLHRMACDSMDGIGWPGWHGIASDSIGWHGIA